MVWATEYAIKPQIKLDKPSMVYIALLFQNCKIFGFSDDMWEVR
jgi:hypothetical protein